MSDHYQSNEDVEKLLRETLNRDGIEGLSSHVTDNLNKWKSVNIKVAVTGNSGAGKSRLINALLE
jgi:predicted GTPase